MWPIYNRLFNISWNDIGDPSDYVDGHFVHDQNGWHVEGSPGERATKKPHHGSQWKYLTKEQWDDFIFRGLGKASFELMRLKENVFKEDYLHTDGTIAPDNCVQGLNVFEIGTGTGAALDTICRAWKRLPGMGKVDYINRFPAVKEVYGIEPFETPRVVSSRYFNKERTYGSWLHDHYEAKETELVIPEITVTDKDIADDPVLAEYLKTKYGRGFYPDFATKKNMSRLPPEHYHLVMSNGVLCYLPDIPTLRDVLFESLRTLKIKGFFSATMLFDNEIIDHGCTYRSITLCISYEKFWKKLAEKLGYEVIEKQIMGTWSGFESQGSRYTILLQKTKHVPVDPTTDADLADAIAVHRPTCFPQDLFWPMLSFSLLSVVLAFFTVKLYIVARRMKSENLELNEVKVDPDDDVAAEIELSKTRDSDQAASKSGSENGSNAENLGDAFKTPEHLFSLVTSLQTEMEHLKERLLERD